MALWMTSAALAVEPAITIPGALRIEKLADGVQRVTLKDGATALVTPLRDGYIVRYSDQRPGEVWTRTWSGYSVNQIGLAPGRTTQRTDGKTIVRGDGSKATVSRTSAGTVVREENGATTRWTTNRAGDALGTRVGR